MVSGEIIERLEELGFEGNGPDSLADAVGGYQAWHGLKCDGVLGPVTMRHMQLPRFCGVPDHLPQRAELRKYPAGLQVTYANASAVPGFDLVETEAITDMAIAAWNKTSGLKATRTANQRTATILLTVGRIDGRNGTLAWSQLANLPQTVQKYDQHEPWKRGQGWKAIDYPYIDLLTVMAHELGHAFGLDHAPGKSHLLSPIYSPANPTIGPWEIAQMEARYGQHRPEPDEPERPDVPAGGAKGIAVWIPDGEVLTLEEAIRRQTTA